MGSWINYFKNNNSKKLKDLIFENYSSFRQWSLDLDQWEIFKNHLPECVNLNFDSIDKKIVDELTSDFIGFYCDSGPGNELFQSFGSSLYKRSYYKSDEIVMETNDAEFIRLWNFLIKGRSLKDNMNFNSFTNEYKIGFLTCAEYKLLKEKIETHFDDLETMRTSEDFIGLKCVLQALDRLDSRNIEIITAIDN